MRHRFHSICPYFAMFPETFVEKHLAASRFDGVVFDPFCGRGTAVFESLIRGRQAAGCDIHPVAACVSGAKCDSPTWLEVISRLGELENACLESHIRCDMGELEEFFSLCFAPHTFRQVQFLRHTLDWRSDRTDRFVAALCLGALHGESHRSPNYFSNRMPRTISTKAAYSIRWWRQHDCKPPERDVFSILRHMTGYRYRTPPPARRGEAVLGDARDAASTFRHLRGQVTDVITSPPYLDTTNYREDQWLRLWFLGEKATDRQHRGDGRHYYLESYRAFLVEAWAGMRQLLDDAARIVIRIGGRRLDKDEAMEVLHESLNTGLRRSTRLMHEGVTSRPKRSQANAFRGARPSPTMEHDFCFLVSG